MKTLVIRALSELTNPDPDTPILPEFDPALIATFSGSTLSGMSSAAVWQNSIGTLADAADLDILTGSAFAVGQSGARNFITFTGSAGSSYLSSGEFADVTVPSISVLLAVRFQSGADINQGNIISVQDVPNSEYAYVRRLSTGAISVGANATSQIETSAGVAPINEWHFIAVVFSGSDSRIVVNDLGTNGVTGIATVSSIRVGANLSGAFYANMHLAHAEIYTRSLSIAELQERRAEIMSGL